jgi:Cd2+/Zn2+-exporting ATPase
MSGINEKPRGAEAGYPAPESGAESAAPEAVVECAETKDTHSHEGGCACCHDHGNIFEEGEDEGGAFFTPLNITGIILFAAGFATEHIFSVVWWLPLALLLAAYLIIGHKVLIYAGKNIARGKVFDENFLMCVASIGAFIIGEYPEAVAVMLFYMIGEHFQDKAVGRSRRSIRALMDIRPDTAFVIPSANLNGGEIPDAGAAVETAAEDVEVGSFIAIRPGGLVPLDSEVLYGEGDIDMKALTGETVPVDVGPGDAILSGAVNGRSLLVARVTKPFTESTASKIIDLAQSAAERKAPAENFISRFARVYTPIVVAAAAAIAVVPPLFGIGVWADWIMRGLVFLVVSCPCALVISIPVSYFGGIGGASSRGILVKGGNYLDALGRIEAVVFDKTGTLTEGKFKVQKVYSANGFSAEDILAYAAAAESASSHPIAQSIVERYVSEKGSAALRSRDIKEISEKSGYGVSAAVDGKRVICGNSSFMDSEGIAHESADMAGTVAHIAVDGSYAGYLLVADEIKPDSAEAISLLKERGITRTVMLTGDVPAVAEVVGADIGIGEIHAGLLPQQKVEIVEKVMSETKGLVAVVGDGINDAPMLAIADVGVVMGGLGSDAAVEAADVVIMNDAPSKIVVATDVARRTKTVVAQNIALALGVKGAVMLLAAIGIANMWEAVFADVGVALLAVLNATRAGR